MSDLLFLAHRIPYPPNKGDKVRSYHLLRHLSGRHRVHLGCFVDDREDWRHMSALRSLCADVCAVPITPRLRRLKSLIGLSTGEPLSLPYFRDRALARWVDKVLASQRVSAVLAFSSPMAQYVPRPASGPWRVVLDFVDVDSAKWRQYAHNRRWPSGWLYAREGERLLAYERAAAARADMTLFVTAQEADLFRKLAPEVSQRVGHLENGVDTEYFDPSLDYPDPYAAGERVLVFTGAMDYRANVDAVQWFAREVFPSVRARVPTACFYIVGARPTAEVLRLDELSRVRVTGTVPDMRPYLKHAVGAVAPLRLARGVQNKVLEAFAMGKPVVLTTEAMDGIQASASLRELIGDTPEALAALAIRLLQGRLGEPQRIEGRRFVQESHAWDRVLAGLEPILLGYGEAAAQSARVPRSAATA